MKKEEEIEDLKGPEVTDIDVTDFIRSAISHYNIEIKSGLELIRIYKNLVPYISCSFDSKSKNDPILRLEVSDSESSRTSCSEKAYIRQVRGKYWRSLLYNPKLTSRLTSTLQAAYIAKLQELPSYDFSEFNITTLIADMNANIRTGIEDEIMKMFDRLTEEHSWYPETKKNIHYYTGWSTNKAHKIAKKVILPCYGVFSSWDGKPRSYNAVDVLSDIERIFNFLDGGMSQEVDLASTIERYFQNGITKISH